MIRMNSEIKNTQHFEYIVKGSVQGVNFRLYTKRKAKGLGLTGYVKNLTDGNVLVIAEGEKNDLYKLLKWLRTKGSPNSDVTDVIVETSEKLENYSSFRIEF